MDHSNDCSTFFIKGIIEVELRMDSAMTTIIDSNKYWRFSCVWQRSDIGQTRRIVLATLLFDGFNCRRKWISSKNAPDSVWHLAIQRSSCEKLLMEHALTNVTTYLRKTIERTLNREVKLAREIGDPEKYRVHLQTTLIICYSISLLVK